MLAFQGNDEINQIRQGTPWITYHQDISSEGSSERVIEVNNPIGKDFGLLEIISWMIGDNLQLVKGDILLKYLNRNIDCQICEVILSSGLERPQKCSAYRIYGLSGKHMSGRIVISQGEAIERRGMGISENVKWSHSAQS